MATRSIMPDVSEGESERPSPTAPSPTARQYLEYWGLSLAARFVALLPYRVLPTLADGAGAIVCFFDGRGRWVARENLIAVFGRELPARRIRWITRRSYQIFARTMLELFWAPNLTRETYRQMGVVEGLSEDFHADSTQPVVYVCLHAANFELLSLGLGLRYDPGVVVTQRFRNPLLGPIFDRLRSSTGHIVIPQERSMIRMFRHLKRGGYFCMLIDLNLDPKEPSVLIDQFGGLKACVTQMHAALALRTGARIVPAECRINPDGTYRLIHHKELSYPPDATAEEIAQICWNVLAPSVLEQPETWLWSYKHWRFKPSVGGERYPAYANTAKRFDKLVRRTNEN